MKRLVPLVVVLALTACSKKSEISCNGENSTSAACLPKQEIACNGESSKSVITSILRDEINKHVTANLAAQATGTATNVDSALIRANSGNVSIHIEDVLTTKTDPNSTKKFCSATLRLNVPTEIINNADAVRSMLSLNDSHQQALQSGVDFDADTVKSSLDYSVQRTDDGQKVYGSLNDQNAAVIFVSALVGQSMLKNALESQKAERIQQDQSQALKENQRQTEIDQAQIAQTDAALRKARADIKAANNALNVVWNTGSREWRQTLLPEQRLWLAQRENGCKLKALDTGASGAATFEIERINCQVQMTEARTEVLKTLVQEALTQASSE
ncbi:lysozyme inhibitor LprI family protein [uncultured Caballeronia sp.]|uniref:lysozyme inhibitor LprI family protein n=1 Tax=uncultured Caballeronia sp. TaxID=1827198 RepID=UPI0015765868